MAEHGHFIQKKYVGETTDTMCLKQLKDGVGHKEDRLCDGVVEMSEGDQYFH